MPKQWWPWHRHIRKPNVSNANVIRPNHSTLGVRSEQPSRRSEDESHYLLPPTLGTAEHERLTFQHYVLRQVLRGNFQAPFALRPTSTDPQQIAPDTTHPWAILDVGCGTGVWAREMAVQFPSSQVWGVDLTPPPEQGLGDLYRLATISGPNCFFEYANILDPAGLPLDDHLFDFVHQRALLLSIPTARWLQVLGELIRVTCPGGWIELVEGGPQTSPGPIADAVQHWAMALGKPHGIDITQAASIAAFLRQALTDAHLPNARVVAERHLIPVGKWGDATQQRVGQLMARNLLAVQSALADQLLDAHITSQRQLDQALQALPEEWSQRHDTIPVYVAYVQIPDRVADDAADAITPASLAAPLTRGHPPRQ